MKIAIITAIYDGYETLKPPLHQVTASGTDVEWICVTDGRPLPDADAAEGWQMICDPQGRVSHPNRAAKRPKLEPWRYTDADASVWIDGSYRVTSPFFAQDAVFLAAGASIAQFVHPWRNCYFAEAAFSAGLAKYAGEPVERQAAVYSERACRWAGGCGPPGSSPVCTRRRSNTSARSGGTR